MGVLCGGGSDTVETRSESTTQIPEWVEKAGKGLFERATTVADRPFPVYPDERLAFFTPEEMRAFDMTEANVGSWWPAFSEAFTRTGLAAAPVGAADVERYMNPFSEQVISRVVDELNRQYERDKIARHDVMSTRGSYLNEANREAMDAFAREARDRNVANISAEMLARAYENAVAQGNVERNRLLATGQEMGRLGPLRSSLGYADVGALLEGGGKQREREQQALDIKYADFLREFGYPQETINWLMGVLRGVPYETTTITESEQPIAAPNPFASALGAAATIAGAGDQFGFWGPGTGGGGTPFIGNYAAGWT